MIRSKTVKTIKGSVKFIRKLKTITFLYFIDDNTQYVDKNNLLKDIKYDDYILIGAWYDSKDWIIRTVRVISKNHIDIQYSKLVWNESNKEKYRTQWIKHHGKEILKKYYQINQIIRQYFDKNGFIEIFTPTFCNGTREGARSFIVPSRLHENKYYSLAQSPQIFKQMLMAAHIDKYYQICSVFRDESTRKDRLFGEFKQIDVEILNTSMSKLNKCLFNLFQTIHKYLGTEFIWVEEKYQTIMDKYGTDKPDLNLKYFYTNDTLPYNDETKILLEKYKEYIQINEKHLLVTNHLYKYEILQSLGYKDTYQDIYLFLYDFPYYEYKMETGTWEIGHNPFTKIKGTQISWDTIAYQFDVVYNGFEITSGGMRNNDPVTFKKLLNNVGITDEVIQQQYGALIDTWYNGIPPHGGFGIGLERYLSALMRVNIKDVVAFPLTSSGIEMVTNAPNYLEESNNESNN